VVLFERNETVSAVTHHPGPGLLSRNSLRLDLTVSRKRHASINSIPSFNLTNPNSTT